MKKIFFKFQFSTLLILIAINLNAQKTKLKVGDEIPNFSLLDQHGMEFNSLDYLNKQPLVIFFYPKDNAPTCTKQICSFRDNSMRFKNLNAKVIGINPAYLVTHTRFAIDNKIQYSILSDKDNRVQKMFGVPNIFMSSLPKRYTFIIDKLGIIKHIYHNKNDAESHIEESIKALSH